jgi:hypothetical protein
MASRTSYARFGNRFADGSDTEQLQQLCLRGPRMICKPDSRLRLPLTRVIYELLSCVEMGEDNP